MNEAKLKKIESKIETNFNKLKQKQVVVLDKEVKKLVSKLNLITKKEYKLLVGNGTWLLVDKTNENNKHVPNSHIQLNSEDNSPTVNKILNQIDSLDSLAQQYGMCLSDVI